MRFLSFRIIPSRSGLEFLKVALEYFTEKVLRISSNAFVFAKIVYFLSDLKLTRYKDELKQIKNESVHIP